MAMTLAQLQSQLSGLNAYTPESEDTLRQRAQAVYDPQYEQDLAALRDNLQQSVNATERGAIRTGMQRSSYNNASLVGLVGAGQKAQAQLAAQREGNIANLLLQLINGERDRQQAAQQQRDNLLLNLYQLGNQNKSYYYPQGLTPADTDKAKTDDQTKTGATGSTLPTYQQMKASNLVSALKVGTQLGVTGVNGLYSNATTNSLANRDPLKSNVAKAAAANWTAKRNRTTK